MNTQPYQHRLEADEPSPPPCASDAREAPRAVAIDSSGLLQGRKVLTIQHRGEVYRLQETRQGKLILTK